MAVTAQIEWCKGQCPICGEEFDYGSNYKPVTCGKFSCVQEALKRGILEVKGANPYPFYGARLNA